MMISISIQYFLGEQGNARITGECQGGSARDKSVLWSEIDKSFRKFVQNTPEIVSKSFTTRKDLQNPIKMDNRTRKSSRKLL